MRVISGKARGTNLFSLEGNHTRPTSDKVKEAMFSIINFYLYDSMVLDLFAGSGALGIEALSRGAKKCFFVENNLSAGAIVKKNIEKTRFSDFSVVKTMDFKTFLNETNEKFDVILLDPPYNKKMCDKALKIISDRGLLREDGIIVCETEIGEKIESDYILKKEYKYGKTKLSLFFKGDLN
ncbi:MAG: 16S rRNA (guanine(966)-N(2))-methyltransferase RsmD [Clostridia bacterium]|nr:16S rRNA (guanine(966)-N(2))-methyltransferase RsmD [Clostridia bacterium]